MRALLLPALCLLAACGNGPTGGAGGATATSTTTLTAGGRGGAGQGGAGQGGAVGACQDCGGACVDLQNDPRHCGACEIACADYQSCDHGSCHKPDCQVLGLICPNDHLCCGEECCPPWKMCCNVPGGDKPTCVDRDAGACPTSCATCL